eukprot:s1971_g18.t1
MLHAVLCAVSHHPQPSLATQVATNVTTSVEHDDVSSWQSDELEALLAKESPVHKPETEINNSSATTGATAATTPTKKKKKRHHKSKKRHKKKASQRCAPDTPEASEEKMEWNASA